MASASHSVSPLSGRSPCRADHVVMTCAPGDTPEQPKSRIRAWAVPVACPSQQCVPAPASPLQWRQCLPRTHCHGCPSAAPLHTTILLPDTQVDAYRHLLRPFPCSLLYSLCSKNPALFVPNLQFQSIHVAPFCHLSVCLPTKGNDVFQSK